MYSVYNDTVLDPFWGTGTTTKAAMVSGRNSIGYEIEEEFISQFKTDKLKQLSEEVLDTRLQSHKEFVRNTDRDFKYTADNYDFPVTTKQEKPIQFYNISDIQKTENVWNVHYTYQ